MVKIRFATLNDVPAIAELGRDIYAEARASSHMLYDENKLAEQTKVVLGTRVSTVCILLAEDSERKIVGIFAGYVNDYFYSETKVAANYIFYVRPEYRHQSIGLKLLTTFRKWAENRGAKEISISITSGTELERTDTNLKKLGFEYTGGNYSLLL
ncbi:MAG: GNAT family N-acetyltransferase [Deltaproteobacteria bacterium]|nr:GNAT family N-acetyltransferase [Deltaproteobacteria bacterium]